MHNHIVTPSPSMHAKLLIKGKNKTATGARRKPVIDMPRGPYLLQIVFANTCRRTLIKAQQLRTAPIAGRAKPVPPRPMAVE
ncbi:hypothetical protein A0H81_10534 [Grifola frondosa]|uniref:Uncharacterized protein n=1 Tax=Grifola frondosa TaxID=5627 RepID=A0A1C7LYZ9_GRIFR|nr:hypothetical protein A0H81_10534 [Grifola frondosa]